MAAPKEKGRGVLSSVVLRGCAGVTGHVSPPVCDGVEDWKGCLSALGTSVKEWGCAELSMEVPSIPSAVGEGGPGVCSVFFLGGYVYISDLCSSRLRRMKA